MTNETWYHRTEQSLSPANSIIQKMPALRFKLRYLPSTNIHGLHSMQFLTVLLSCSLCSLDLAMDVLVWPLLSLVSLGCQR